MRFGIAAMLSDSKCSSERLGFAWESEAEELVTRVGLRL